MEEELIKTKELCDWLRVSNTTVMRWRNEGVPYIGKGRSLRYKRSEVEKWMQEQDGKQN